jgi:poly(ADP-ribose) glycohydrolase
MTQMQSGFSMIFSRNLVFFLLVGSFNPFASRKNHRLQVEDAQRDLQKAFIGFQGALQVYPASRSCATGNWGCGAFGGSAAVKVFIQWMAASLAGLESLEYFPWDDGVIHQLLRFS